MLLFKPWALLLVLGAPGCLAQSTSFLPFSLDNRPESLPGGRPDIQVFEDVIKALSDMQDLYFQPWVGEWPTAIDWTAAVMGSHVTGALQTLSEGLERIHLNANEDYRVKENLISRYFSELVGYYFGQDYFAIRNQAFDDMLWVVLGWLDTIQFSNLHNKMHYQLGSLEVKSPANPTEQISEMLRAQTWQGSIWTPAFAHRARTFWDLASTGWDTKLCDGGMNWNPRLEPYKNAITNELFISGSIAMYLHFPGDNNSSPFGAEKNHGHEDPPAPQEWKAHDPKYLKAAVEGYKWLTNVGMMNNRGLYADGFHVSGYNNPKNNNTKCDLRDEMVYTYNQGVVLSGQLGLFQATGSISYLQDGHRLIQSVINATGYNLMKDNPVDDLTAWRSGKLPQWYGLGRAGILEEACDARGDCSQDSQTFKGIFFHHFVTFCASLKLAESQPQILAQDELNTARVAHQTACQSYTGWVKHNAEAALRTRDSQGRFGMWWTVGALNITLDSTTIEPDTVSHDNDDVVDYRTYGVPNDPIWVSNPQTSFREDLARPGGETNQKYLEETHKSAPTKRMPAGLERRTAPKYSDPNNRGRGRTVETQGGGLAVLRALWEITSQG